MLGAFDSALEIQRVSNHERRRKIIAYSRCVQPPELIYEMNPDGKLAALGASDTVFKNDIDKRILEILTEEQMSTKKVRESLDPRPGQEAIRLALTRLAKAGKIKRNPSIELADVHGKTTKWSI